MNELSRAVADLEAQGALPKQTRSTLEDECTHILSERLNDQAPLYEESYRPHAQRMIQVIGAAERARIRRELLDSWQDIIGYAHPALNAAGPTARFRAALDRICPEEP